VLALGGCQQDSVPRVEGIEVALNDGNFEAEVLKSEIPVLVDFGASWCGPCRQMEPTVAYLSVQYKDRVKVGKVDVDESPSVTSAHKIDAYPTLVLFRDGEEIARAVGGMSYRSLSAWVDEHTAK